MKLKSTFYFTVLILSIGISAIFPVFALGSDIYAGGCYNNHACYWKNWKLIILDKIYANSIVNSITIDKSGNIYAGGHYESTNGDFTNLNGVHESTNKFYACYWYNGSLITLDTNGNSEVTSIAVDNSGNVYAGGQIGYSACYWNNRKLISLKGLTVTSIAVDNLGNVYAGGSYYDSDLTKLACFWKNGTLIPLEKRGYSEANSITIDKSGNVYVCGLSSIGETNQTCFWKNGTRTTLICSYGYPYADSIIIDSFGIVYTGGAFFNNENHTACYWKNSNLIRLNNPHHTDYDDADSEVMSIAVDESGNIYAGGDYGFFYPNAPTYACYWKNGVFKALHNKGVSKITSLAIH